MKYYFSKKLDVPFEDAVTKVIESLGREGFGVLTDIDVSATFKKKLDVNFRRYRILGACNPSFAYQALQTEDKVGTMLPCNVIVQEFSHEQSEVAAIDPLASMQAIENPQLQGIADRVREKLQRVVSEL